jgi:hypothetical protein
MRAMVPSRRTAQTAVKIDDLLRSKSIEADVELKVGCHRTTYLYLLCSGVEGNASTGEVCCEVWTVGNPEQ